MKSPSNPEQLEALIGAALLSEPLRAVPEDFHRCVTNRLHIAALMAQERRRFRLITVMAGLALACAAGCVGLFVVLSDLPGLLRYGVPGGMGYIDYVAACLALSWTEAVQTPPAALLFPMGIVLLVALISIGGLAIRSRHMTIR